MPQTITPETAQQEIDVSYDYERNWCIYSSITDEAAQVLTNYKGSL
jgi:hypothetical protein